MNHIPGRLRQSCGAALVTALFIMAMVLVVGVATVRAALNAEKAARNMRDHHIALQCAEAALQDAERDIEGGADPASVRAARFAPGSALGFIEGCGANRDGDASLGLCMRALPPAPAAWQGIALAAAASGRSVPYGSYTGAALPAGVGALPARLPRYIIELMPFARAGEDAGKRSGNFYRITAIGFGAREQTVVVLQSFYRKAAP
jgi:Tfp pilus assembly protein PilX